MIRQSKLRMGSSRPIISERRSLLENWTYTSSHSGCCFIFSHFLIGMYRCEDIPWIGRSDLSSVNIGNARLYGMEDDLGLKGNQYPTAVSLLFVTYILAELPSNLVLKRFTPSRWIAFITTVNLSSLAQGFISLIVL